MTLREKFLLLVKCVCVCNIVVILQRRGIVWKRHSSREIMSHGSSDFTLFKTTSRLQQFKTLKIKREIQCDMLGTHGTVGLDFFFFTQKDNTVSTTMYYYVFYRLCVKPKENGKFCIRKRTSL